MKPNLTNWSDINIHSDFSLQCETMLGMNNHYKGNITKSSRRYAQTDCRRRDTESWGKVGREKNRTCLQGRLKIKRNTIPACIWVEASPPSPPTHTLIPNPQAEWLGAKAVKICGARRIESESLSRCCPVIVRSVHCWSLSRLFSRHDSDLWCCTFLTDQIQR